MPGVRLPLLSTWPTQLKFLHIRPDRTEEPLGIATSSILQDSNSSSYPKNRTEWCINEKCTKHESRGVTSKGAKKCHVTTVSMYWLPTFTIEVDVHSTLLRSLQKNADYGSD